MARTKKSTLKNAPKGKLARKKQLQEARKLLKRASNADIVPTTGITTQPVPSTSDATAEMHVESLATPTDILSKRTRTQFTIDSYSSIKECNDSNEPSLCSSARGIVDFSVIGDICVACIVVLVCLATLQLSNLFFSLSYFFCFLLT